MGVPPPLPLALAVGAPLGEGGALPGPEALGAGVAVAGALAGCVAVRDCEAVGGEEGERLPRREKLGEGEAVAPPSPSPGPPEGVAQADPG